MTGRERVKACLDFQSPDRTPRDLWVLPYIKAFRNDEFERLLAQYPPDITGATQIEPGVGDRLVNLTRKAGSYKDDWGSVWYLAEPGIIGEVKEPVLDDWRKLESFKPPKHLIRERDRDAINRTCEESSKFVLSDVTARPFERLQFLRGSENLFIDLAYGTKEVYTLLDLVHEYYLDDISFWCDTGVDGVIMMDDWGTAISLLIDPEMWRELFKPIYSEYCELIHKHSKYAFFHSDGNIEQIYADLIEVGFDAINSQLFTMDTASLLKKYKGKVTFWGEIDRQHILPFGSKEDVRDAVMLVRGILEDGRGGVIAQCEWGKGNSYENIETVYQTWAAETR